ncbi:hypothetical protein HDE69_004060 [Pedobacter cryoconitis]|uniref:Luciferase domain-containing protein n=1 Tax=Pedobacter cryoconitis TaxID=188932 RepID=A0A7W8YWR3_9SPHI|nr:luciferase family protein [Pedobacter cryoconitis]MBB5622978.1 hypothetical protein [Pedobacter cryoconitis]
MKKDNFLFSFVVKRFGFLKTIPLLALIFDSWLKLWMFICKPEILDWLDEIEAEVLTWKGMSVVTHRYGGLQFDLHGTEIGHIHSNGIMDVLLTRQLKQELLEEGRVVHHHVFSQSGWISFYMISISDKEYAKALLLLAYHRKLKKYL